jgi:hypothetical protein
VLRTSARGGKRRPALLHSGKMKACVHPLAGLLCLVACAHALTPDQEAMVRRGDCAELLRAADAARAQERGGLASSLANGCTQERLSSLVNSAADPAQAMLWCGRAKAAWAAASCDAATVASLASQLRPHLTVGPPDPQTAPDPAFAAALAELGPAYNLAWQADEPDVIVGRVSIGIDHATNSTIAQVTDAHGAKQRVPAVQHRFVARAQGDVDIAGKTRVLRASEEVRDLTWDAAPKIAVAAKYEPQVPPEAELRRRAALAWVKALAKALAAAPPEGVDVSDARGCVAYGLSLNLLSGDPMAAANGLGDPAKIATCEKLLEEPAGAGIPVP